MGLDRTRLRRLLQWRSLRQRHVSERKSFRPGRRRVHEAALAGKEWWTKSTTTGKPLEKKDAAKLLTKIAEGTRICGDPGLHDGAIQKWHTCADTEPIHSTNPCSEYVFLNNTACNLASLN